MPLEFNLRGKARPNCFVVIDDFGTKRDSLNAYLECGPAPSLRQGIAFRFSEDHDSDVVRAREARPRHFCAREAAAFASPIGLSIEAEIRIDFELIPAWDEHNFAPMWTQAKGAQIRITDAGINEWEWNPTSTSIAQKALEAFCWAYVEMERAREDASVRRAMETEQ